MKKRIAKFIISFTAIVILVVVFSVSAFADVVGGAGLLGSALGSLNVDLLAGGSATVAALAPWLNGDFSIIGALTGVADGYIKVGDESVTIDGVQYESIYLDPSMAAELHTQAFDFITQKAITSNSSGILAEGIGYLNDVPIYDVNGTYTAQDERYDVLGGSGALAYMTVYERSPSYPTQRGYRLNTVYDNTQVAQHQWINTNAFPITCSYSLDANFANVTVVQTLATGSSYTNTTSAGFYGIFDSDSFEYDYVAGVIDATPLPVDYGFQAFVPTNVLTQAGITPSTYIIDGGTGTDTIIELIQLLDDLYGQDNILDAEFVEEIVPPVPPQPVDVPLGEVPYEDFLDTFGQSVYGKLDSISDGIDTVGQVIDGVGTDVIEAIDTAGQSVLDGLSDVEGAIDTAGQSVVDSVEESTGIIEDAIEAVEAKVDELADSIADVIEEIMTHPLDLFSAWLDRLPEIPAIKDIFDGIKRHVGIWHYVVEWLGCIGTFLAFFIGLFGDVAYCMVVPIYACVAGAICLAFYKRFAR